MKISTEKFNLYSSVINRAKDNESSNRANMFFDPDNGICSCIGSDFNFKFSFDIVEENKEDLKPFRVDIERLLAITAIYEELVIDKDYIFYGNSDRFKLYIEKDAKDLGFTFDYNNNDNVILELKEQDLVSIGRALQFVGEPNHFNDKNMNVVRISEGTIVSSNGSCIYQNTLSNNIDFTIDLSDNVGYLLFDLFGKGNNELKLYYNEENNGFAFCGQDDTFEVISEPIADVYLPDDDKLSELENSITKAGDLSLEVVRSSFRDMIDFFGIFVSGSINEPIVASCYSDKIEVEGTDDSDNSSGKRSFTDIGYISKNMQDFTFTFPRKNMSQALNTFVSDNVKLQLGIDENGNYHFVRVQEVGGNSDEKISTVLLTS
jgi:hypothetical protein